MTLLLLRPSSSTSHHLSSILSRSSISLPISRQFSVSRPSNAKSPPGRGKDALRKARRQKLLDEKRFVRLSSKGVTDPNAQTGVLAMTKKQREEKREQEKKDEELSIEDAGNVLKVSIELKWN